MRGVLLSSSPPVPILLGVCLVLSAPLLWGQKTERFGEFPVQSLAAPFGVVADARAYSPLSGKELPTTPAPATPKPVRFEQNPGQSVLHMEFSPRYADFRHLRLPGVADGGPYVAIAGSQSWAKEKHFLGEASSRQVMFAANFRKMPLERIYSVDDVERYARHIRWIEPLMQRVDREAEKHPHLTRALSFIQPQF